MTVTSATRHLFLDLEGTIITPVHEGWLNTSFLNVPDIKSFIRAWKPQHLHVFSFAIYDAEDLATFSRSGVRAKIERVLQMEFDIVPTLDREIKNACCYELRLAPGVFTRRDVSDFWGKQLSFRLFTKSHFERATVPVEVALIDDMVTEETFSFPRQNLTGHVLHVHRLDDGLASLKAVG